MHICGPGGDELTHLPLVLHLYASVNWVSIGSDNGLSPVSFQAITWTNADILSVGLLGANFSEIQNKIQNFSFSKMHLKISSIEWRPFCPGGDELIYCWSCLTHWGRVTHICVGNLTIIGSDNGLSPGQRQAITWTNVGISLIEPLGTNFSEMLIEIHTFSFKKIHLKMSSAKWRPISLGLNVLIKVGSQQRKMTLKSWRKHKITFDHDNCFLNDHNFIPSQRDGNTLFVWGHSTWGLDSQWKVTEL